MPTLHRLPMRDPQRAIIDLVDTAPRVELFTRLVEWIGPNRRALSLDGCTGDLRKQLERNGCRIDSAPVVAECEIAGFRAFPDDTAGDALPCTERYDAILAIETLSRAADPRRLLQSIKTQLGPHGVLFLIFANGTHARHRLAMLHGDLPLEWHANGATRCLTYASVAHQLCEAGFAIGGIEREREFVDDQDFDEATRSLAEQWANDVDASTVRYLLAVYPLPADGMNWLHERMRFAAEARDHLETVQLRFAELWRCHDDLSRRERELGDLCIFAQTQLAARDDELRETNERCENALREVSARLVATERDLAEVRRHRDELTARFARMRSSLPGRIYHGLKNIVRRVRG